ncbi:uncharacterized protein LOC7463370 isoform X2 [Populus trichocarpa]|uniref:uncharacterized protein LOC7463370 isoform X2 n=1 Tax=Populus trichocarpa TaxID=3694 RepID=UPI0022166CD2|nr:uncharacterized protein LOC7463370 isoform X2 [Populus trichocarpa]KAI5565921.1 hypothetical protein BDE02_14G151300 [Populus trichocarpa]KAI5565925.1 hypothetical protein BDE02_14G151300 [Populus trichocarpa]
MSNSTFSDSKADLGNCMHAVINEDTSMNAALINKMRKRMAGMNKHIAKYKNANTSLVKENLYLRNRQAWMKKSQSLNAAVINKNTNTSLVKEIVYLRNRQASMTKSHKRQKRTLVHLKDKYNELTDKTTGLSTLLMESYAQLQERNTELEASNAQLRERNVVLENESDARDEVNKENEHELDQAII